MSECGKRRKAALQIASLDTGVDFSLLGGNKLYNVHMQDCKHVKRRLHICTYANKYSPGNMLLARLTWMVILDGSALCLSSLLCNTGIPDSPENAISIAFPNCITLHKGKYL